MANGTNQPLYNELVIGTCSECGGPVVMPVSYLSVIPPTPYCKQCGATKLENGPVIPMRPSRGGYSLTRHTDATRAKPC